MTSERQFRPPHWKTACCFLSFFSIVMSRPLISQSAVNEAARNQEVTSVIAKSIIDPDCLVILGESRLDARMRLFKKIPTDELSSVTGTLMLSQIMPLKILRGNSDIDMDTIWIQANYPEISSNAKHFHYIPNLETEGVWLLFLKPVSKLPLSMSRDTSEMSAEINRASKSVLPHDLAKHLKFEEWLNRRTWFELAFDFSAYRISDLPIRDIKLPSTLSEMAQNQLATRNERIRKVQEREIARSNGFTLTKSQVSEIQKLVTLFRTGNAAPSAPELLSLKSEFANAVLKEIAMSSDSELSDGLLKLKNDISNHHWNGTFKSN